MLSKPAHLQLPSAAAVMSAAASVAATAMVVRSIARDFIPRELRNYLIQKFRDLFGSFSNQLTLIIDEYDGLNRNQLFAAAQLYLQPAASPGTLRFRVAMPAKETKISVSVERNEEIVDTFQGVHIRWKLFSKLISAKYISNPGDPYNASVKSEICYFELSFHRKHKDWVLSTYLPHVLQKSTQVKEERKTLKLFTLKIDRMRGGRRGSPWQSVNLHHPATFDTLALESDTKRRIIEDLEMFVKRKQFYRKVGKAWKRGYLLFGPPGTGKSSLIAAMANYLNFDIYDLELTDLTSNSALRRLLISTGNRSILVVEDIDCSIGLQNRLAHASAQAMVMRPQKYNRGGEVTLSGLLNFIDGLWSSCGDERLIIFTTNHRERLDSALLRPGRMDVHIHLSYCTPCGLRMLASNYLGVTEHPLFSEVETLMDVIKVTPAEVGEQLMREEVPEAALRGLIEFLEGKKRGNNDTNATQAEMGAQKTEVATDIEEGK